MRWDYLVQFLEFPRSGQTKMPRKLLQLKDRHPEIASRPLGRDLIEAGSICVNLQLARHSLARRLVHLRLVLLCVFCVFCG